MADGMPGAEPRVVLVREPRQLLKHLDRPVVVLVPEVLLAQRAIGRKHREELGESILFSVVGHDHGPETHAARDQHVKRPLARRGHVVDVDMYGGRENLVIDHVNRTDMPLDVSGDGRDVQRLARNEVPALGGPVCLTMDPLLGSSSRTFLLHRSARRRPSRSAVGSAR
jgi:hypothetical protein